MADLFLDTFPYNAHTSCSDCLWAGVPILTKIGESFPSRVAASLLTTSDLSELITNSNEDYENKAIYLAKELKKYINTSSENIVQNTNMVFFTPQQKDGQRLCSFMNNKGIILNQPLPSTRMVMHLDITDNDLTYILNSFDEFYNC